MKIVNAGATIEEDGREVFLLCLQCTLCLWQTSKKGLKKIVYLEKMESMRSAR